MMNITGHAKTGRTLPQAAAVAALLVVFSFAGWHTRVSAAPGAAADVQCGTIQERGVQLIEDSAGAQQAAACFSQAYAQQQSATLVLQIMGVDTTAKHTFTLGTEGGQYLVKDTAEFRVIPRPAPTTNVYTCSGVAQTAAGLVVAGCGDEGDIVIPLSLPGMPSTGSGGADLLPLDVGAAALLLVTGAALRRFGRASHRNSLRSPWGQSGIR